MGFVLWLDIVLHKAGEGLSVGEVVEWERHMMGRRSAGDGDHHEDTGDKKV